MVLQNSTPRMSVRSLKAIPSNVGGSIYADNVRGFRRAPGARSHILNACWIVGKDPGCVMKNVTSSVYAITGPTCLCLPILCPACYPPVYVEGVKTRRAPLSYTTLDRYMACQELLYLYWRRCVFIQSVYPLYKPLADPTPLYDLEQILMGDAVECLLEDQN
jgi:hypothetical protein